LEISDKISINSLLALINLLPELESLKIHSLLLEKLKTTVKSSINYSIHNTNKIKRLYLKKMSALEELFYLLNLFHYIIC
jgi:hypothetical protein